MRSKTLGHDEHGFTLVEVMVAAAILVSGVLGALTMLDGANRNARKTNARVAATNLGREIVEHTRSLEYRLLTPTQLVPALQAKPGLAPAGGGDWVVTRRGVTYRIQANACTFDDPKDGLAPAAEAPENLCAPAAAPVARPAGAAPETNGDDFRRVDVTITWTREARAQSLTQTALIVNPSGSLGPRLLSLTEPVPVTSLTQTQVAFTANSSRAQSLRWSADDGVSGAVVNGPGTSWSFNWDIGSVGATNQVLDGTYTVTAQALDSRGVAGDSRFATVVVDRQRPRAPLSATGGPPQGGRNVRHGGIVDLMWAPNPERDVVGYRVVRMDNKVICQGESIVECTDATPLPGELRYDVFALDHTGAGTAGVVNVNNTSTAPARPGNATVALDAEAGAPLFQWTPASTGGAVFYRVYRRSGIHTGAPSLTDRYATTRTSEPRYIDPSPATTRHTYWFSAVASDFNESIATDPVYWP